MGHEAVNIPLGGEVVLPDGTRLKAYPKEKLSKKKPGAAATHETRHAVVAIKNGTGVVFATIIPGPGYSGLTQIRAPDAVATAAPHAHGDGGTGHDVLMIVLSGHDLGAAMNAARSALSGMDKQVHAVAAELEERGTLMGADIERIMKLVENGQEIVIEITSPKGKKETRNKSGVKGDTVMLMPEDLPIEKENEAHKNLVRPLGLEPRNRLGIS